MGSLEKQEISMLSKVGKHPQSNTSAKSLLSLIQQLYVNLCSFICCIYMNFIQWGITKAMDETLKPAFG